MTRVQIALGFNRIGIVLAVIAATLVGIFAVGISKDAIWWEALWDYRGYVIGAAFAGYAVAAVTAWLIIGFMSRDETETETSPKNSKEWFLGLVALGLFSLAVYGLVIVFTYVVHRYLGDGVHTIGDTVIAWLLGLGACAVAILVIIGFMMEISEKATKFSQWRIARKGRRTNG